MNQDDIDFDKLFDEELPFKPLTHGLGFHQQNSSEKSSDTLRARTLELEKDLNARARALTKSAPTTEKSPRDMGDLAPFYSAPEQGSVMEELNVSTEPEGRRYETAGPLARTVAFLVDLSILFCALMVAVLSAILASGVSFSLIRESLTLSFGAQYLLPITLLFYLFYFSFFDKTNFSTLGKKLMGLQVVSENGDRVKMSQSLMRSILIVFSILTAGLASVFDLQSKLTETRVVKK